MTKETARRIDEAAADWAARVDRGPLSPDEEQALNTWLRGDPRRPGAYARIHGLALHTERARALGPKYEANNFRRVGFISRRGVLIAGGGIAASVASASLVGVSLLAQGQRYTTRKGQLEVVALADGSVVTLNTASRIAVNFSKGRRDIELLAGEALFDVAKDPSRPFVVAAGTTQVRAVGTSFTVKWLGDTPVQVLVREGVVEVTHQGPLTPAPIQLAANHSTVVPLEASVIVAVPIADSELHRELAWKDGRLAFEGQTLAEAAVEFSRYSDTRIVIDDPILGKEEIAGLFQANDPVGFAQGIAITLNAHTQVMDGEVHLVR